MNLTCEHGQLARSCYICELETERDRYRAALEEISSGLTSLSREAMEQVAREALDESK